LGGRGIGGGNKGGGAYINDLPVFCIKEMFKDWKNVDG
jgi:hypothetical protein